jgi:hypothetical protein
MNQFTRQAMIWASVAVLVSPVVVRAQYIYTVNGDNTITITGYTGEPSLPSGALSITNTINDLPVTSIGDSAFTYCTSLTSITIPASVQHRGLCVHLLHQSDQHHDPRQRHQHRGFCVL